MNEALFIGWLTFGSLQTFDLATTHVALRSGAVEVNPVMQGSLTKRVLVKSATTAGVVVLTHQLSKRHPKVATAVTWGLNGLYAGIVVHNWREAGR